MGIEELVNVPSGFKFDPTNEELIMYYLLPKVNGMALPCEGVVTEKVVYGENSTPWEVFDEEKDPWVSGRCKNKKTIYVFTKLKRKNKGKKQIERIAGCGTWDGQTASRIIRNGAGQIIGSRKYFSFESRKFGNENYIKFHGHWGMHEFSVSDGLKVGGGDDDYVLCAITRDDSKRILKELIISAPLVDAVQNNYRTNGEEEVVASGSINQVLEQEVARGSVVHQPLDLVEVASEYGDPMLFKEDVALQQVHGINYSDDAAVNFIESHVSAMIEYNGSGNLGEFQSSAMIEYNGNFGNSSDFQVSTMIEYNGFGYPGEFQGSTTMGYGQLADLGVNNNLQHQQGEAYYWDDSFDFGNPDAIGSIDGRSEALSWENQWLGKRKLLEEAENPCRKKCCGNHN